MDQRTGTDDALLEQVDSFMRSLQRFSFSYRDLIGQNALSKWTPVLTFATVGNLSVTYSAQLGFYFKIGPIVFAFFNVQTSAFTHTTASGNCRLTGLPTNAANVTGLLGEGNVRWSGITKANYTHVAPRVAGNGSIINFTASGSGVAVANVDAADVPSGGTPSLTGYVIYFTNN